MIYQDWRNIVLGKINTQQVRLLNKLEEMWNNTRPTGNGWIPCDQIIMAVFLDRGIITKSDTFEVNITLLIINSFPKLLISLALHDITK